MTKPDNSGGETVPAQGEGQAERQQRVPRAPHERDESASSQEAGDAPTQEVGKQAKKDLDRGLVDTDKRAPMDRAYELQR
ncbi:hypothetical protein GHT07_14835 [Caenimonas koreensis DSM 17982]|uniref:Uncharacterized protein n=1 Tax=Caenimonas koreensis DSM 17982 TaxID=1121255 RepID=A0A844BDJ5_9BURK|nr:hypothetical protein [Caenimonas koreensis]MRD48561.1 hypothetical protein [Caenimonas koreensis DSM 17982]